MAADANDASFASDVATFKETMVNCAKVLEGKPMLVLANKQDSPGARSAAAVAAALGVAESVVVSSTAHPARNEGKFDSRIERGLEWLLGCTESRFDEIYAKVSADKAAAEATRAAEKIERHRRVMTKVLAEKAFPAEGEPMEVFSETDGYEFMASELLIHDPQVPEKTQRADSHWGLPEVAQKVARLVGFQKMAMQMCADMTNPDHKVTKTTHTWDQVVAYVTACRVAAVKPVVALIGTTGAGKSVLLKAMGGDADPKPRPTMGFSQNKLPFELRSAEMTVHW